VATLAAAMLSTRLAWPVPWLGSAMMGTGEANGEGRAIRAAEEAIANPLLDEISLKGATSRWSRHPARTFCEISSEDPLGSALNDTIGVYALTDAIVLRLLNDCLTPVVLIDR
jgi:hypothetical protein